MIYGEQHRFLPLIAFRHGFSVREIDVQQEEMDAFNRGYPVGVYLQRILDILSVYFVIKFTQMPLRFFGTIGVTISFVGALIMAYLLAAASIFGVGLFDHPVLLLGGLMVVSGIQIVAVGLIGEFIIFVNSKALNKYRIEKIL